MSEVMQLVIGSIRRDAAELTVKAAEERDEALRRLWEQKAAALLMRAENYERRAESVEAVS